MISFLNDENFVTSSRKIVGADAGAAAGTYDHDVGIQDPRFGVLRWSLENKGEALSAGTMSGDDRKVDHSWESGGEGDPGLLAEALHCFEDGAEGRKVGS